MMSSKRSLICYILLHSAVLGLICFILLVFVNRSRHYPSQSLHTQSQIAEKQQTNYDIHSCPRVRKAWHLTTEDEKQLYITGIHRLNHEGKIKLFGSTHYFWNDTIQAHFTAEFFAWHRYFIWEFENQMRRLGAEYACFALPYWDVSTDAGLGENALIFKSGLGDVGDSENDECVDIADKGEWSVHAYPLVHVCHSEENPNDNPHQGCCLKRSGGHGPLSGVSSYTHFLKKYDRFGAEYGFRYASFAKYHSQAHWFVGGIWQSYTHMISAYAPEDPIFYLLHAWVDYIFVVWKQCWAYNLIDSAELDSHPKAYFSWPKPDNPWFPDSELDSPLLYVPMNEMGWFENDKYKPTARSTWAEQSWNFAYERGTFIHKSHLSAVCEGTWDDTVLLPNSAQTLQLIAELQSSEVETYEQKLWQTLLEMTDDINMSEMQRLQTWDAKTCNFQRQIQGKQPCYVPQSYEKCTREDLERKSEIGMDELLQKEGVSGNDCLEEVRINIYAWAKSMGMLYDLCMGEFDAYFVCEIPNIQVMIDMDDSEYYDRLLANKERMEREAQNGLELSVVSEEMKMNKYARVAIDVIGYVLIAFVIGVCAFLCSYFCAGERRNKKDECNETHSTENGYGSIA